MVSCHQVNGFLSSVIVESFPKEAPEFIQKFFHRREGQIELFMILIQYSTDFINKNQRFDYKNNKIMLKKYSKVFKHQLLQDKQSKTTQKRPQKQKFTPNKREVPRVQIFLDKKLNTAFQQVKQTGTLFPKAILQTDNSPFQYQQDPHGNSPTLLSNKMVLAYIEAVYKKYQIRNPLEPSQSSKKQAFQNGLPDKPIERSKKNELSKTKILRLKNTCKETAHQQSDTVKKNLPLDQADGSQLKPFSPLSGTGSSKKQKILNNVHFQLLQNETQDCQEWSKTDQSFSTSKKTIINILGEVSKFDLGKDVRLTPKKKLFVKKKMRTASLADKIVEQKNEIPYNKQILPRKKRTHTITPTKALKIGQLFEIPQKYRYCFFCQSCILEGNMDFHESKCQGLQMSYKLSWEELQVKLEEKISRIRKELLQRCRPESQKTDTKSKIKEWLTQPNSSEKRSLYQTLKSQISEQYLLTSQLVNKLHWFQRLRDNFIKKQVKIQEGFSLS